jgi:GAF domain-containing protein
MKDQNYRGLYRQLLRQLKGGGMGGHALRRWLAEVGIRSSADTCNANASYIQAAEAINSAREMRANLTPLLERMVREDPHFFTRYSRAMLMAFVDAAIEVSGATMANLQVFDRSTSALRIGAQRGFDRPFLEFFDRVNDGHAACGTAFQSRSRVIVEDVGESPIFLGTPALEVVLDAGVRAVQSTPLVGPSGSVVGILSTHRCWPGRPSERDLRLLDLVARSAGAWLEQRMYPPSSTENGQNGHPFGSFQ